MNNFSEIKDRILKSKKIIVTSHVNPDGDAIGAGLSLTVALKKLGKDVRFILQDDYPQNVSFLKKIHLVEKYNDQEVYDYDLLICVDSATLDRVGEVKKLAQNSFVINLDHHISNPFYGNLNYVEEISSTSELIYNFFKESEIEIDLDMAEALYTGLVNDTGNFEHNNVTEKTFKMAAELKAIGVENSKIVREFFKTKSFAAIKLLGKALYEMKFIEDKKLVYYFMSKEDLNNYNGKKEDTEGIVESLISYQEAEISLFLREDKPGQIKGSMRSKHDVDVNKIAGFFNGGGHKKAAGFTSDLPAEDIIKIVLSKL